MLKRVLALVMVVAMAFTLMLTTGCGQQAPAEPTATAEPTAAPTEAPKANVKVGFIFVGPVNDGGWSQAHYEGMKYMEEKLGVETAYKELVPETADCEKTINDLIDQGCNVIFATSFGFMDFTEKVAKDHPDVKFFHCSGYKQLDNMANYFGRMYEARYLSGIVAGMKTKANKIGYVAAYEIPEVINGINAFALGVKSVNPDAKVLVRWSHTWIDPALEKAAAIALLDEKCDVLTLHNDSTAVQTAAEERGAFAVGYDLDTPTVAPKAYMTAPIWHWGPYYVDQVQKIIDGTWKSEPYHGGIKEGILDLAPLTSVAPEGAKEKVDAARQQLIDGTLEVFKGPIKAQDGTEKVAEGKALTYADTMDLSMNWFVDNVEGKIEKK